MSISFDDRLLADIDRLAKLEHRSQSEVMREAVRLYIERRNRWDKIFALGETVARAKGLFEQDVTAEIQAHRRSR